MQLFGVENLDRSKLKTTGIPKNMAFILLTVSGKKGVFFRKKWPDYVGRVTTPRDDSSSAEQ